MIYYFSGTRNSRYAALRLGSLVGEEVRFIPEVDPYKERIDPEKDRSVALVFPVYAWGVPPLVMDFISRLPEAFLQTVRERGLPVWCVATCGDETGMAVAMLRKALEKRGMVLSGAWSLIMPNVYVLLPGFGVDSKEVEERKLSDAVGRIKDIASRIMEGRWEEDVHLGPWPRLKTSVVYPLFKRWGVNARKWHYTDACIGCGKCAGVCPVGNIAMAAQDPRPSAAGDSKVWARPVWGSDCTSCCACYHVCPTRAAQYGSITENAGQYFHEDKA